MPITPPTSLTTTTLISLSMKSDDYSTILCSLKKKRARLSKKHGLLSEMAIMMPGSTADIKPIAIRISKLDKRIAIISKCNDTTIMLRTLKEEHRKLSAIITDINDLAETGAVNIDHLNNDIRPYKERISVLDKRIEEYSHIIMSAKRTLYAMCPHESKTSISDTKTKSSSA